MLSEPISRTDKASKSKPIKKAIGKIKVFFKIIDIISKIKKTNGKVVNVASKNAATVSKSIRIKIINFRNLSMETRNYKN